MKDYVMFYPLKSLLVFFKMTTGAQSTKIIYSNPSDMAHSNAQH